MGKPNADDFNSTVLAYFKELSEKTPLPREEEEKLIPLAKNGDENAKNKVIEANLRFVFNVAKKYKGHGVPIQDLISEGNLGLMKALERFDEKRGIKFITYAVFWIKQAMIKTIQDNYVKGMTEETTDMNEEQERLDVEDTSTEDDVNTKDPMFEIPSGNTVNNIIDRAMSCLTTRERDIIQMNYGMNGYSELSLKDIGDAFGLTGERIRHIKQVAMRKMRSEVMANNSFFDE